jgi:hypothetical protein
MASEACRGCALNHWWDVKTTKWKTNKAGHCIAGFSQQPSTLNAIRTSIQSSGLSSVCHYVREKFSGKHPTTLSDPT